MSKNAVINIYPFILSLIYSLARFLIEGVLTILYFDE